MKNNIQEIQTQLDQVNGQLGLLSDLMIISKEKGYISRTLLISLIEDRNSYKDELSSKGFKTFQEQN